jgi:hypothetical protein
MTNEAAVEAISGGADQMGSAINAVAATNLVIAILMGATA